MTTLADFLLARIAEDEADARLAVECFEGAGSPSWSLSADGEDVVNGIPTGVAELWGPREVGQHIARWDPPRVLADCEAKRRIVELLGGYDEGVYNALYDGPGSDCYDVVQTAAVRTLFAMALPYADHPDYREEWNL